MLLKNFQESAEEITRKIMETGGLEKILEVHTARREINMKGKIMEEMAVKIQEKFAEDIAKTETIVNKNQIIIIVARKTTITITTKVLDKEQQTAKHQ